MSVVELLHGAAAQGVELWAEGSNLRFRSPRGALTPAQREELTKHKQEVLAALRTAAEAQVSHSSLSFNQRSLWFVHQDAPQSSAYHVGVAVEIMSPVNVDALNSAAQALTDRHPMLRTTYGVSEDGVLQMETRGAIRMQMAVHDASALTADELHDVVAADYVAPFDLANGPVIRCSLYSRSSTHHVLLVCVHHIAGDGWSTMLMADELFLLYAEATGQPVRVPPRAERTYTDFVRWQEELLAGADGERLAQSWRQTLAAPRAEIEVPSARPRPARKTYRGATHAFDLSDERMAAVKRVAREHGTTPFVVLLAAYQALLFRLTGTSDVVVGTPTFGRSQPGFERIVGHFVNPVPLRTSVHTDMAFRALLDGVSRTVRHALDGQDYPLLLMVQNSERPRDPSRSPLFEVFFGYIAFDRARSSLAASSTTLPSTRDVHGLTVAPYPVRQQEGQFDLSLQFMERDGGLDGTLLFSADLYEPETIAQMCDHYLALLDGALMDVNQTVEQLPPVVQHDGADHAAATEAPSPELQELLDELAVRDVRLALDGERLKVNAPVGSLNADLKSRMAHHKAGLLATLRQAAGARGRVRRISRDGPIPLSYAQQRLWFLDRMQPGNTQYNLMVPLRLTGPLDVAAMRDAIDAIPRRHEALRIRIRAVDGNPRAELTEQIGNLVRTADVSHLPAEERLSAARSLVISQAQTPFDLATGPLMTGLLVHLSPDDHIVAICMHHIASDGWSLNVAVQELCAVYDATVAGLPSPLPPLTLQYIDFAAWQREQINAGTLVRQIAYWQRELADAPVLLELPTDRPRPAIQTYRGARRKHRMDGRQLAAIKAFSRAHDATLYMTLLAAWQVLLHRYSGQDDVLVGSPLANRDDAAFEAVIGCFVNHVMMRGRLGGNPTFRDYLARTAKVVLDAFDHRTVPFDRIVEAVKPERSTSHSPIMQVTFTLQTFPIGSAQPTGLHAEYMEVFEEGTDTARFDITLEIDENGDGLRMIYEYATDLFDDATITRMHEQYLELLVHVVERPELRLSEIPLLTDTDRRTLLDVVNDTAFEHDRSACLHTLVTAMASAVPDAMAVQASDTSLTYRQLDRRSNQMAQLLRDRGVKDRDLVGVCLDRIADLPVALLAVLKAGAAYVPIDPAHPAERLVYTLTDATVSCVITESRFAPLVSSANAPLLLVDGDNGSIMAQSAEAPHTDVGPRDLAYVIYTSGSTGRPKGVEVEHRNVVNFLRCMEREPGFGSDDVLLAVTTPSFDIAGLELLLPLITGASSVIASREEVLDGEQLIRLLQSCRATVMQATPATWRLMLDAGWTGKADLRVLCGGEAMPRDLARDLLARTSVIWNMYGPTETTIWSTTHRVTDAALDIPIGHPIGNTTVYVLDAEGQPSPIGVAGELCIGGEGVARGYRQRPELTAEKFVRVVLQGRAPERVYRTGDVVRWRSDLSLEFVGRRDHQVKLRGYRIELGEIESVLVEHISVRRAVVIVREDAPGDQRLVAYVVPAVESQPLQFDEVRTLLRSRLPEYMVPSMLVPLSELPLTPNGKIDRKALPAPTSRGPVIASGIAAGVDVVMTEPQRRVAAIWREVLRVEQIGVEDNFFDRGGHSLLVVKVHAALRREFQRELTLVDLFQHTTIAAQAALLSADPTQPDASMQRARARAARQVLA